MTVKETVWTDLDLTAEEVVEVLASHFNISGSWEDKMIDDFFEKVNDEGSNWVKGWNFKKLDYDEPFGSGPKHLYMEISKPIPLYSYTAGEMHKRQRQIGVFQLTGYFNSWDNGEGPGYWENTLTKVYPQVVEKFEYLTEPPKKEKKNATSTTK